MAAFVDYYNHEGYHESRDNLTRSCCERRRSADLVPGRALPTPSSRPKQKRGRMAPLPLANPLLCAGLNTWKATLR